LNLEGRLRITLACDAGTVKDVRIASSRPLAAVRVLLGKTPQQLVAVVPLLFGVCGNAQAFAARQACLQALGATAEPDVINAGLMLVQLETLREHCWRILLDWPGLLGLQADKKLLAPLLRYDAIFKQQLFERGEAFSIDNRVSANAPELARQIDALEALIDQAIFQGRLASWRSITTERGLIAWTEQNLSLPAQLIRHVYRNNWQAIGQNAVALLPEIENGELEKPMHGDDTADFCRAPTWGGHCFETTVLNRQQAQPLVQTLALQYGNALLTRIAARLLEVSNMPDRLRQRMAQLHAADWPETQVSAASAGATESRVVKRGASTNVSTGLAQVQAARGLLLHRVRLEQGVVSDYRIVAPTEWNFHPGGAAAASLKQLRAHSAAELKQQAELLINALDPCVAYEFCITAGLPL
jgi:Ni,Fe-hydrogenase I large subunit